MNQGYSFYNYSSFEFKGHSSPVKAAFIAGKTIPITSQTFLARLRRDLGYHLITTLKLKWVMKKFYYDDLYNNEKVYELTMSVAAKKNKKPKFVYTHLVMPHYRYYFDSIGNATPFEKIIDDNYCADKDAYIEYLQYANKKLLALLDSIKKTSASPPVIILMSDHGYHQFLSDEDIKKVDKKYYFMTLNAVYFPNGNYSLFYDSMSNVNQFRVVLNSLFRQNLPLLKDSTIFLAQ
jgi:Sulfatase